MKAEEEALIASAKSEEEAKLKAVPEDEARVAAEKGSRPQKKHEALANSELTRL